MISFNGDYKRKPEQNLGGIRDPRSTRTSLISNAKIERERREQVRKHNENATKIQSAARSFMSRKLARARERSRFDEYLQTHPIRSLEDLEFLLVRLLFFYEPSDQKRFISVGQAILKDSSSIFTRLGTQSVWQHRINRLLLLSIRQLSGSEAGHAIPLRLLDLFTNPETITRHVQDPARTQLILEGSFSFLIRNGFFASIRQILDQKTPPLDGSTSKPPTPFTEALLQLIVRPLGVVSAVCPSQSRVCEPILQSFIDSILSPPRTDPVYNLLVPYLSTWYALPFAELVKSCQARVRATDATLSPFLLCNLLKITQGHVPKLDQNLVSSFVDVLAHLAPCMWRLPRRSVHSSFSFAHAEDLEDDSMDEDDSDDEDTMDADGGSGALSAIEKETLREIVGLLNNNTLTERLMSLVDVGAEDPIFVNALCRICHVLMVHNRSAIYEYPLVYMLCAKTKFIRIVWYTLTSMEQNGHKFNSPLSLIAKGILVPEAEEALIPLLSTFCAVFSRLITTLHDDVFVAQNEALGQMQTGRSTLMPFTINEVVELSAVLKDVCLGLVELAFPETRPLTDHYRTVFQRSMGAQHHLEEHVKELLYRVCVNLLRQVYNRDLRRNFCPPNHWTVASLNLPLDKPMDLTVDRGRRNPRPFQPIRDFTREDLDNGPPMSTKQMRSITILRNSPFVVLFNSRVNILQGLLAADKLKSQGEFQNFLQGPSLHIKVRRSHLYEDSFEKLSPENEPDLKPKVKVQMINAVGLDEAGIDGGGIFREFLSELIRTAFDPNRGFFLNTTENKLYPNPGVGRFVENFQKHYYFIGRVLGKAIYENLLVELPLADFFLTKLAGRQCDVDIHQLASLDPVLHKNLLSLEAYDGDDLGLDFTVVSNELGETRVEELKPGGANIPVNASNRIEYIQLMADYKLNKQIRKHCIAFREGLNNVLPIEWLFMFSNVELQVLISGAEIPVDIDDLRLHAKYGGHFDSTHPTIELFWSVVAGFTDEEKRMLLKFVTSLSRPPLLGFKDLEPPFTIQDAVDTDRLPSASTCMNLLKLPPFQSASVLREKLLYAITANTGFELS